MATYDKAHELARALKESEEYKEYHEAKKAILGNDAALSILRDYQHKRLEYEIETLSGKGPDSPKKLELDKMNEIVNMHGPVKRFLAAEQRIMVMIADIQKILTDALDLLEYS